MSLNNITIPEIHNEMRFPLIEKLLVIGIAPSDVKSKKSLIFQNKQINLNEVQKLPIKILEEYKSNSISYNTNSYSQEKHTNSNNNKNSCLNSLLPFIFPKGIQAQLGHNNPYHSYLSFTVNLFSKRKHISILNFYENYTISGINFSLSKSICLISNYEIYNTMNSILSHLYQNVISPEIQTENSKNGKNYSYLYIKNQDKGKTNNYLILQEKKITEFFCSFILNSLTYTNTLKNSIIINYPNNNIGKSTYLSYNIESKEDIPLKDYDISILFNCLNVDDIIILYGGLLMGYKIILLFDNYSEINQIIFSLLSLIYPLKWKKFPIISYISEKNSKMIDMVESPVSVIIGLDINYKDLLQEKIKDGDCQRDTYVYNLISKSFVPVSKENNVNLPSIIGDEIKIELHRFMAEKISLDKNINTQNSELAQMFGDINGIDSKIYYNYKIISIFYFGFLQLIKELPNCIKNKGDLPNFNQNKFFLFNYFDLDKFKNDKRFLSANDIQFMYNFSTSMIFSEFLHKYIMNSKKKEKFVKISKHLSLLNKSNNNEDDKIKLSSVFQKQVKEYIIQYYDFSYISMDNALENYYSKLQDLCISNRQSSIDKNNNMLWYPLEIYKVKTSPGLIYTFITSKSKDESTNKLILSMKERGNIMVKKELENYKEFAEDKEKLSTPIKYSYSNISFEDASTFISTVKSMAKYNKDFYFHQSIKKEKSSNKKLDKVGTKVSILVGDNDECDLFSE